MNEWIIKYEWCIYVMQERGRFFFETCVVMKFLAEVL